MTRKTFLTLSLLIFILLSTACGSAQVSPTPEANMPNPASVHCEQNGGKLEFRQDASGGTYGVCLFPDGSECDEWAYFRDECQPGDSLEPAASSVPVEPASTGEVASDGWKIYRNAEFGYSFQYPADCEIVQNDNPLRGITIVGPVVDGESWPAISFSHPRDLEAFRPPEGVDLLSWLQDHFLLAEVRLPDVQIAGTTAIHQRHDRSPQSYAFDQYYFARAGQLYQVTIGHSGDREDWDLYNHFLESIQFEQ